MSQVDEARFVCEGCKKTYRWKPELAGKKVKCKCGAVMTCPAQEPGAAPEDLYDLAPEGDAPSPRPAQAARVEKDETAVPLAAKAKVAPARTPAKAPVAAVAAPKAAAAKKPTSPMLGYAGGSRFQKEELRERDENVLGGPPWREIYVPAIMVLVGLALQVIATTYLGKGKWLTLNHALPQIGFRLVVDLVLSFVGIFFVIKMFEVAIGSPGPAVLKLAAICLLVPGLSGALGMLIGSDSEFVRMMVASMLTFPLGLAAFKIFFDMDFIDTIYCVVIISLVNDWAMTFLIGLIFSGGGVGI
jgi:hypothetical protein